MKIKLPFLLLLLFLQFLSFGQEVASFSSVNNSGDSGTIFLETGLSASGIRRSFGISEESGGTYNSSGWTTATSLSSSDYLEWTLTLDSGFELDLSSVTFRYNRDADGPRTVELQIFTSSTGWTTYYTDSTVPTSGRQITVGFGGTIPTVTTTASFRLYAYNASSSTGTLDIETTSFGSNKGVVVQGNMINPPSIAVSETELSDFDYEVGNGPSASQTFTVSGSDLTSNLNVQPLGGYEISQNGFTYTTSSISFTPSSGNVPNRTIHARLRSGLSIDFYDGIIRVITSGASEEVAVSGNVTGISGCTDAVDFGNLQFPTADTTINLNSSYPVYAQAYEPGITETAGDSGRIDAWIGYSTTDTNPNTWTNWVPASYNAQVSNNDEYVADLGTTITSEGTYYYASRFSLDGCNYTYGGPSGTWSNDSVELTVVPSLVDFCNVDFPKNGNITVGGNFDVFAQAYEPGVTDATGQGAGLECWIGYNTVGENYLPDNANNWTWIAATYDSDFGNNDQYTAEIGSSLPAGTYYFASRWRLNGGAFSYGGIQSDNVGNFWDTTNNSGTLLVGNPSTLAAGDIAITGFNADNPDRFSFVLLTDINAGTQINFTDNGWQSSGMFRNNEGTITWTALSDMSCGDQILIEDDGSEFVANIGLAEETNAGFDMSASGDQILAYQGADASPTFLYAVTFDSSGWSDATSANTTAIPTGLTDTLNAVNLGETDNGSHDCTDNIGVSAILASVSDFNNWNTSNSLPFDIGTCSYSCVVCGSTTTWDDSTVSTGSWDNGAPDENTNVIIDFNYSTSTQGSFDACSLTISSGATLRINNGNFVEVIGDVSVSDGEIITETRGSFVQRGDGTTAGTFTLVDPDPLVSNSVVNKNTPILNSEDNYVYWSSPVVAATVEEGLFDANPARTYTFDAANFIDADGDGINDSGSPWLIAPRTDTMNSGQGFIAMHGAFLFGTGVAYSYTFEGAYNTGPIAYPISYDATNALHWNLIGNPYPSAIDVDALFAENGTSGTGVIYDAVYMWSQVSPPLDSNPGNEVLNFNQNDYITINAIGEAGNGTTAAPQRRVPSGQAFFVASTANGNINFENSMRVSGNNVNDDFYRTSVSESSSEIEKLYINLSSDIGIYSQICVAYANIATDGYDGHAIDTNRNYSGNAGYLVSLDNNGEGSYVIQGKAQTSLNEDEVIKLGFGAFITTNETYTIEAVEKRGNYLQNNPVYIKDNFLNITHDLQTPYTFSSDGGYFTERFEIVFKNQALSIDDIEITRNDIIVSENEDNEVTFELTTGLNTIKTILIYDLQGRLVYELKGNSAKETYKLSNLNQQIFVAKVELDNGIIITKKAIKK